VEPGTSAVEPNTSESPHLPQANDPKAPVGSINPEPNLTEEQMVLFETFMLIKIMLHGYNSTIPTPSQKSCQVHTQLILRPDRMLFTAPRFETTKTNFQL
jgi:hypothetical protein